MQAAYDDNPAALDQASKALANALVDGIRQRSEKTSHGTVVIREGHLFNGGLSSILEVIVEKCANKLGIRAAKALLQVCIVKNHSAALRLNFHLCSLNLIDQRFSISV